MFSTEYVGIYNGLIYRLRNNSPVWHCTFDRIALKYSDVDMYNCIFCRSYYGVSYACTGTFERVILYKNTYAVYMMTSYQTILKNANIKLASATTFRASTLYVDNYMINMDCDAWTFTLVGSFTKKIYRQYEFDAHCQDKEGNDLSEVSAVGEYISPYGQAFSVTTDANGDIATQTVDHGWFEKATGDTENLKTPLKVTYSKAGYQTVVKYYDLDEKTKDTVVLHKAVGVFLDFGRPIVNLKKTDPENKNVMAL